jgi:PRC-barrel domain
MRCFVLALAVIGLVFIPLRETPTHAADWRFSQSTDRAVPVAPDQSTPAPLQGAPAPDVMNPNTKDGTPATVLDDHEAVGILGKSVYSAAGEDMGHVVDVIVKRNGEVRAAVIDFGGFLGVGNRTIAVDWSALRFPTSGPMDHIILEFTRDQVRLAPEYKPGEPLVVLGSASDVHPNPETPAAGH